MREKYYLGSQVMISNAKISGIYAPSLRPKQRRCKKAVKQQKWWIVPKGTTYKGASREKKRGICEKRKTNKGGERGRKIENKRVEEKIRREKRKRFSEKR